MVELKYKYIKVEDDTHQAFKMFCITHDRDMQDVATEWINDRLLKEAGIVDSTN